MAGVDPVEADVIMRAAQQLVSLDKPVGDDSDAAQFGDLIPDESGGLAVRPGGRVDARRAPAGLPRQPALPRQAHHRAALRARRRAPQTLDKVAKLFQLTRERTRQIEEAALRKLSTLAEAQALREAA